MTKKKETSKTNYFLEALANLESDGRYRDGILTDYSTYYACKNGSSCCDDDYCRCGTITNTKVTVEFDKLITGLNSSGTELDRYCLDRLGRELGLNCSENWEAIVSSGYYGEECSGTRLQNQVLSAIRPLLIELSKTSIDAEKIKICLAAEYGFVLSDLESCTSAQIMTIPTNDLLLGNRDYSRKLKKIYVDRYNSYTLPRAICIKDGSKYRIIDGYHRVSSALNLKMPTLEVIVLT